VCVFFGLSSCAQAVSVWERGTRMGLAQCVSLAATQVFGERLGAGASFGTAQVIANGRGQGSCGQTGTVVGKCSWQRSLVAQAVCAQRRQSAPALPSAVDPCCAARSEEPNNVLVSSRSSIDAPDTTLPLLLSSMRAPFRCPFMHAQLHHPSCATGLRTKAPTARHTQCSSIFQLAHRLGMLAACARRWEGERAGGHLQIG
jgi:hypothetical protein